MQGTATADSGVCTWLTVNTDLSINASSEEAGFKKISQFAISGNDRLLTGRSSGMIARGDLPRTRSDEAWTRVPPPKFSMITQ